MAFLNQEISHNHQLYFNIKSQCTSGYHVNHDDDGGYDDFDGDNDDESKNLAVNIAINFQSEAKMWVTQKIARKKYAK